MRFDLWSATSSAAWQTMEIGAYTYCNFRARCVATCASHRQIKWAGFRAAIRKGTIPAVHCDDRQNIVPGNLTSFRRHRQHASEQTKTHHNNCTFLLFAVYTHKYPVFFSLIISFRCAARAVRWSASIFEHSFSHHFCESTRMRGCFSTLTCPSNGSFSLRINFTLYYFHRIPSDATKDPFLPRSRSGRYYLCEIVRDRIFFLY